MTDRERTNTILVFQRSFKSSKKMFSKTKTKPFSDFKKYFNLTVTDCFLDF